MIWQPANALFACQPAQRADARASGARDSVPETRGATLPQDRPSDAVGLEVLAGPAARFTTYADPDTGCYAYLWGRAAHPSHDGQDLIRWCAQCLRQGRLSDLSELVGLFVLLIDDRRNRQVHLVSDPLGIQPWFVGQHDGRLVSGSAAWPIIDAGLCGRQVDYDAIAGWLYYGYDCDGGSLLNGLRRLAPGCVTTLHADGQQLTERPYVAPEGGNDRLPREQVADCIHDHLCRSFDALTRGLEQVSVAISGGYDSRLLAAMAARRKLNVRAYHVAESAAEAAITRQVADILRIDLRVIPTDGTQWNIFGDDPHVCFASGFPVTKQVSHVVAEQWPGVPILNGFLGDILVRVTGDRADRDLEFQPADTLSPYLTRRRRLPQCRTDLLAPHLEKHIERRAGRTMRRLVDPGSAIGKPFLHSGLYGRQRCYTSSSFLAHLDLADALTPFHAWPLIDLRFRHDPDCFTWETHELIFHRHYPELSDIPHPQRLPHAPRDLPPVSRSTRAAARRLLRVLANPARLRPVNRRKVYPRLMAALAGRRDVEPVVGLLHRMDLLESRCRQAKLPLDWEELCVAGMAPSPGTPP